MSWSIFQRSVPTTELAVSAVGFEQLTPEDIKDKEDNKELYDDHNAFMDSLRQRHDVTEGPSPTSDRQVV